MHAEVKSCKSSGPVAQMWGEGVVEFTVVLSTRKEAPCKS